MPDFTGLGEPGGDFGGTDVRPAADGPLGAAGRLLRERFAAPAHPAHVTRPPADVGAGTEGSGRCLGGAALD